MERKERKKKEERVGGRERKTRERHRQIPEESRAESQKVLGYTFFLKACDFLVIYKIAQYP